MLFEYFNLDDPSEKGATQLLVDPVQGMPIEFADGREWIVERLKAKATPWHSAQLEGSKAPIAKTPADFGLPVGSELYCNLLETLEGSKAPIAGTLYLRPVSNILETTKTPADFGLPVGSKLYCNLLETLVYVAGVKQKSSHDRSGDCFFRFSYEIDSALYATLFWPTQVDIGHINSRGLPSFVVIPDRFTDQRIEEQWVEGYQAGLRFPEVEPDAISTIFYKLNAPQYVGFQHGYSVGKQHLAATL
jgi:hypothetical protein